MHAASFGRSGAHMSPGMPRIGWRARLSRWLLGGLASAAARTRASMNSWTATTDTQLGPRFLTAA